MSQSKCFFFGRKNAECLRFFKINPHNASRCATRQKTASQVSVTFRLQRVHKNVTFKYDSPLHHRTVVNYPYCFEQLTVERDAEI